MKKIFLLIIPLFIYIVIGTYFKKNNIIPDDAIRIRVLANSNSDYDQQLKKKVKDNLEVFLYDLLSNTQNSYDAKQIIVSNMGNIEDNIKNSLDNKEKYSVNFGKNYFPTKEYKGITYEEGYYDSLLVTLGDGLGDNWWCVLFPPLCLLEGKEYTDVEYTTFVSELINNF